MFKPLVSTRELSDGLRDYYFLWDGARHGASSPSLSRLGLHRVPKSLDRLVMTEILRASDGEAVDFEFLYIGRAINGVLNEEQTGRRLSATPGRGPDSEIWEAYVAIARDPQPLIVELPYTGPDPRFSGTTEIFLPVDDDIGDPRFVMVGVELLPHGHGTCAGRTHVAGQDAPTETPPG